MITFKIVMLQLCYKFYKNSMSLANGFDKHIKAHYNMSATNQNKSQKIRGVGDRKIDKKKGS